MMFVSAIGCGTLDLVFFSDSFLKLPCLAWISMLLTSSEWDDDECSVLDPQCPSSGWIMEGIPCMQDCFGQLSLISLSILDGRSNESSILSFFSQIGSSWWLHRTEAGLQTEGKPGIFDLFGHPKEKFKLYSCAEVNFWKLASLGMDGMISITSFIVFSFVILPESEGPMGSRASLRFSFSSLFGVFSTPHPLCRRLGPVAANSKTAPSVCNVADKFFFPTSFSVLIFPLFFKAGEDSLFLDGSILTCVFITTGGAFGCWAHSAELLREHCALNDSGSSSQTGL